MATVQEILIKYKTDIDELQRNQKKILDQQAKINKKVEGQVDAHKKVEKSSKNLTSAFKKVGAAVAAAFATRQISQFIVESARLYDIQAKAERSLLVALKGRSDIQQRLIKQAAELQKITLFGDEETIKAASRLAQIMGVNEEAISKLLPLVQDFAAATGTDLSSAAELVGKSVGSSTNALTRYGIEIQGAVGSSERLESAIEALNKQVGGQAAAAAEVGTGAIQQMNMAFDDLKETVGFFVVELLDGLAPALKTVTQQFDAFLKDLPSRLKNLPELNIWRLLLGNIAEAQEELNRIQRYVQQELEDIGLEAAKNLPKDEFKAFLEEQIKANEELLMQAKELAKESEAYGSDVQFRIGVLQALQIELDQITEKTKILTKEEQRLRDKRKKEQEKLEAEFLRDIELEDDVIALFVKNLTDKLAAYQIPFKFTPIVEVDEGAFAEFIAEDELQSAKDLLDEFVTFGLRPTAEQLSALDEVTRAWLENQIRTIDQATELRERQKELAGELVGAFADIFSQISNDSVQFLLFQKSLATISILINQAQAIADATRAGAAGSFSPIDLAIKIAAAVGTVVGFIAQAKSILNQANAESLQVPQFSEGVIDLPGKKKGKDSVLSWLAPGESVMTHEETKQHKDLFQAIRKKQFDQFMTEKYILPTVKGSFAANMADSLDTYRLERAIRGNKTINLSRESAYLIADRMSVNMKLKSYH